MRDFSKDVELVQKSAGKVESFLVDRMKIYNAFFSVASDQLFYQTPDNLRILDISPADYARDFVPKEFDYTHVDYVPTLSTNASGEKKFTRWDPNFIPLPSDTFDQIFCFEYGLGYGKNVYSLFEVERLLKPGRILVCGVSNWWYRKGFNQFVLLYRAWKLARVYEIQYSYKADSTWKDSSQFFLTYTSAKR